MREITSVKLLALPGALRLAARIISREGWVQKEECTREGMCLVEAMRLAVSQSTARLSDMHLFVSVAVGLDPMQRFSRLMQWNDAPGRTKIEVLTALYKAAQLAEEKISNYASLTYQDTRSKAVLGRHPGVK